MLLVYHSEQSDFWIKIANTIDTSHEFKYMLAIRTYAVSPEYFVMMYRAFNEIQLNRIMFNIVSGDIHDSESSVKNLLVDQSKLDTSQKRIEYTHEWMQKVSHILGRRQMPEIVMSGISEKTLSNAAKMADYTLCMTDSFVDNPKKFMVTKKTMVCAAVIIADTDQQAEDIADSIDQQHQKRWTIFGTEERVVEKIIELKSLGATDLLIRRHLNDPNHKSIHELVKKYKGKI